ncbi:acetylglutamate kinase [Alicyclobacillus sp. SP_1]|uniref:acetylglutamate kinase n=1 Tax=Alicyclobacillus sp. SP_1 TaxID=2942475 RepID=UPI00215860F6|nr:acetylglutamate kinase [Alicyclobacillus sp. SP_1]
MPGVVVKVGGSLQGNGEALMAALVRLWQEGVPLVVVHGGGPRISEALESAGISLSFADGLRRTTPEAMSIVDATLGTTVNIEWVNALRAARLPAISVHGAKTGLFLAESAHSDRTGETVRANTRALDGPLSRREIPVVAPIAKNGRGERMNVNADIAASALAGGISAERLVFCTDVSGIYADWPQGEMLTEMDFDELEQRRRNREFTGGMVPKVDAVLHALAAGVSCCYVVDGWNSDSVAWAVLGDSCSRQEVALGTRVKGRVHS